MILSIIQRSIPMNTSDLRVQKTQKALVDALLISLSEKPFEDITVKSICDIALVRRATFYTHFADKYELFAFSVSYIYKSFPSYTFLNYPNRTKEMYIHLIKDVVDFLTGHEQLFDSIIDSNLSALMMSIISSEISKDLESTIITDMENTGMGDIHPNLALQFYISGIFGAFTAWAKSNYSTSKEEFIAQLSALILA